MGPTWKAALMLAGGVAMVLRGVLAGVLAGVLLGMSPASRGLHLSTCWLNISAFCGIGDALRDCLALFCGCLRGPGGCKRCISCQIRLRLS